MADRVWSMTLELTCSVELCETKEHACCADRSAYGATEGCKKILRYRGWKIRHRENRCPQHSGPIPPCMLCGTPTPPEYGQNVRHITGVSNACDSCYRQKAKQYTANQFVRDYEEG